MILTMAGNNSANSATPGNITNNGTIYSASNSNGNNVTLNMQGT